MITHFQYIEWLPLRNLQINICCAMYILALHPRGRKNKLTPHLESCLSLVTYNPYKTVINIFTKIFGRDEIVDKIYNGIKLKMISEIFQNTVFRGLKFRFENFESLKISTREKNCSKWTIFSVNLTFKFTCPRSIRVLPKLLTAETLGKQKGSPCLSSSVYILLV